jgi:hypothetical protein
MSKKKLAGIIVGCIVVVIVVIVAVRGPMVTFADSNLEAAVRDYIGKPDGPIYPSDLKDLTSLEAFGRNITDLSGLEYCTALTELMLEDNEIGDITPISNLTNLELLDLNGNQIDDISALSNLTNLNYLYLADNGISDITLLSNLVKLGKHTFYSIPPSACLDLSHNQISDISPLSNLTSLEWVVLDDNKIRDISPLASLTNLVMLHLANNQIDDIAPLSNLAGLGTQEWEMISYSLHLDLGSNQITDITPLSNLTALKRLSLSDNQISDISPLANLTNLTTVYLWENPLSSDSINIYVPELRARGVDVSLTSQNQQPIEIMSVLGPVGPANPGGPIVEITLKNVVVEPVISLTATLELNRFFDFTFNVTPASPLQSNRSTSDTRCLIGGGFTGGNVSYPLKIHATLQNGAKFVYTKLVQIVEPR